LELMLRETDGAPDWEMVSYQVYVAPIAGVSFYTLH